MPKIEAKDGANNVTITLDGDKGEIAIGGGGQVGVLTVADNSGKIIARISGTPLDGISLYHTDGHQIVSISSFTSRIAIGGSGTDGGVNIYSKDVPHPSGFNIGGNPPIPVIYLDGQHRSIWLWDAQKRNVLHIDGDGAALRIGCQGNAGVISVQNSSNQRTIFLDGEQGDITFANADLAEDFDVADPAEVEPGTLMSLDGDGKLVQSRFPYDHRVAGVIAGAGAHRPGIILDRRPGLLGRATLAMVGKAFCRVDATEEAIEVGDLLTTSATQGHAMKASDARRAFGAVIGKALTSLRAGRGLIPVLVALR